MHKRQVVNFFAISFLFLNFTILSIKVFPNSFAYKLFLFFSQWESLLVLIEQADLVSLLAANFLLFAVLILVYLNYVFLVVIIATIGLYIKTSYQKLKVVCSIILLVMVLVEFLTVYQTILIYSFTFKYFAVKFFLAFICILFLGLLTFFYKKTYPMIYGYIEIFVGISLVYIALKLNIDNIITVSDILRIFVGLYVIVRGLENVYQGSEKVKKFFLNIGKDIDTRN